MQVPDSLQQKMEIFEHRGHIDIYRHGLFAPPSWIAVFLGQGLQPRNFSPIAGITPLDRIMEDMHGLPASIQQRVQMMPEHARFLADYCPAGRSPAEKQEQGSESRYG
jgi:tryptophan halogenase